MAMMAITTSNSMSVKALLPALPNLRFKKVCINGTLSGTISVSTSPRREAMRKSERVWLRGASSLNPHGW